MPEVLTAVYEHGLLRPLKPLRLKEHETVKFQILPDVLEDKDKNRLETWIKLGLITPPQNFIKTKPISEKRRYELADRLGKAVRKPLSEVILEERGEW